MFSRNRLLVQVGFMFLIALLAWLFNASGLASVALVSAFLLLSIYQSTISRTPNSSAEQYKTLTQLLNVVTPSRFSVDFLEDEEFPIAFMYMYTMAPEKLLGLVRLTIEARQSTDQNLLKLVSALSSLEKLAKRKLIP